MRKPRPAEGEETSWKTWPGHAVFLWGKATQDVSRPPTCARPFCGQLRVACSRNYNRRICASSTKLVSPFSAFRTPVSAFLLLAPSLFPARGWKGHSRVSNQRFNVPTKSPPFVLSFTRYTHLFSQQFKIIPFFNIIDIDPPSRDIKSRSKKKEKEIASL